MHRLALGLAALVGGCVTSPVAQVDKADSPSPYLLVFAGDGDDKHQDFLAVVDVRPGSPSAGKVLATTPIGLTASMPHHMEYELPPAGEPLFMNAHHHEQTLLVDVSQPLTPKVVGRLQPPPPFRYTHDYRRLPNGNRLVGFLRSEGPSPKPGDTDLPGNHGGIAEYSSNGKLLRTASAAVAGVADPIRPYAFADLLNMDRLVTTGAAMMEKESADVIQIWRYSDFKLLHTLVVPPAIRADGSLEPRAAEVPFEPRLMGDGSVLFNTYGCGLYRLTAIDTDRPRISPVMLIDAPAPETASTSRGACGVPVVDGRWWVMPIGRAHAIATLDISNPAHPKEVARMQTAPDFNPHWSARDPRSNRIVIGAELGGEQGMLMLRLDRITGALRLDETIQSRNGRPGYIDLALEEWPHGQTGPAWGHAALFMPDH